MAYTSEKERHAIVAYWELTGSVAGAQKLSKQPVKVVRRWIQRYRDTGAVKDAPKSGRRPLLSAAAGKLALDQLLSGEAGGAKSVARNLCAAGHTTTYKNKKGQVARNITASEYGAVVKQTFLPEGTRLFSNQGLSTWTLQQDNDPAHRAAGPVVQQWNAQHASSVSILENWPASSPDLNPIENFWGYLQRKMDAKGCRTFSEYRAALETEARLVPRAYFSKLVGSMPKRLADCIKLEGGKTKR